MAIFLKPDVGWGQCTQICNNLIHNTDVEMDAEPSPVNGGGEHSFQRGYVSEWYAAYNSPHHSKHIINDCDNLNYTNSDGTESTGMVTHNSGYSEGIFTDVFNVEDEFEVFCLNFKAKRFNCNGVNLTNKLNVRLGAFLENYLLNEPEGSIPTYITDLPLISTTLLDDNDVHDISVQFSITDFPTESFFNNLVFHTENPQPTIVREVSYTTIYDVSLTCITSALQGITLNQSGGDGYTIDPRAIYDGSTFNLIETYNWDFGDGIFSTFYKPTHTYAESGMYTVCLDIVNTNGCCARECIDVYVDCDDIPIAGFNINDEYCPTYTFNATNSNSAYTYLYNFGDNSATSNLINPTHTYAEDGTYTVTQIVTNNCDQSDTITQEIVVVCNSISCANLEEAIMVGTSADQNINISSLLGSVIPFTTSGSTAVIDGQHIYLKANLIIDQDVRFTDCFVYCGGGSQIEQSAFLDILGTHFMACDTMWRGIKNEGYRTFIRSNSKISDAEFGLYITNTKGNARMDVINSTFENNYAGIYIPESGNIKSIPNYIKSTFKYTNSMFPAYIGQSNWNARSQFGISASNLARLVVSGSTFTNLQNGIYAKSTSLNVKGSGFLDIDLVNSKGIHAVASGSTVFITDNNTFGNLFTGIHIENSIRSVVNIKGNDFTNSRTCVSCRDDFRGVYAINNPQSVINVTTNNDFDFIKGIGVEYVGASNRGIIGSNTFFARGSSFVAIKSSNVNAVGDGHIIKNNIITLNPVSTYTTSAIHLLNCNRFIVEDNEIIGDYGSNKIGLFKAENVTKSRFSGNSVINRSSGFEVLNSFDNLYCCNYIPYDDDTKNSVKFDGQSLAKLNGTTMHNFFLGGNIGQQKNAGNIWTGSGSKATMADPSLQRAAGNRFVIDPGQTGSTPSEVDPTDIGTEWFRDGGTHTTCSTAPTCNFINLPASPTDPDLILPPTDTIPYGSGPFDTLSTDECNRLLSYVVNGKALINSTNDPYEDQTFWGIQEMIQNYIIRYGLTQVTACLGVNYVVHPTLLDWYNVHTEIQQLALPPQALHTTHADLMTDVHTNSDYLDITLDDEFYTFDASVQSAFDDLAQLQDTLVVIEDSLATIIKNNAISLLTDVSGLGTPFTYLTHRKKVWQVYLSMVAYGVSSISSSDWDDVRDIALMCPLEVGVAVEEAQGLMIYNDEYISPDINTVCTFVNPRSIEEKVSKISLVKVYPNPTSGSLTIEVDKNTSATHINIYNALGKLVSSVNLEKGSNTNIDLSSIEEGIYFYSLFDNIQHISNGKLILIE